MYLLDHEYTQRGLDWDRLKGADASRAALVPPRPAQGRVRSGARVGRGEGDLGRACAVRPLRLLRRGRALRRLRGRGVEDECLLDPDREPGAEAAAAATFQLRTNELVDDEITLGWWTRPDGTGGEPIYLPVAYAEVCATTENEDLMPYQSEYEGYMGNYGNTLDRWYRRAAVVVWPRERAFTARAEAGSEGALRELQGHLDAGDLDRARTLAQSLAPFWKHHGSGEAAAALFAAALPVAVGLREADTATMLLAPFGVETLGERHAPGLAAAAARYGRTWARGAVSSWFGTVGAYTGADRAAWLESLPGLCTVLRATDGDGDAMASPLAEGAWQAVEQQLTSWLGVGRETERRTGMEGLGASLARVLQAAGPETADTIAATLRGLPDTALECLLPALRTAARQPTTIRDGAPAARAFQTLADHCEDRLAAALTRPVRAADDWSLTPAGTCRTGCGLCPDLDAFLTSRTRHVMEWPLAKDGRRHLHSRIDQAGLPVSHTTRRQGRPYVLVLTKTDAVFTREQATRTRAETDLAWLRDKWPRACG